jgi:hypothetical protein
MNFLPPFLSNENLLFFMMPDSLLEVLVTAGIGFGVVN